jgi:hypothetical protein
MPAERLRHVRTDYGRHMPAKLEAGKWTGEGVMSKWTPVVREFASCFDVSTLDGVKRLIAGVGAFTEVHKTPEELIYHYARRPAGDIIKSREIFSLDSLGALTAFPDVHGCLDFSLATTTALRCSGVPAAFMRWKTHSLALFYFEGKAYVSDFQPIRVNTPQAADPILAGNLKLSVAPMSPELAADIEYKRTKGRCLIGLDPHDVGIKSIMDFWNAAVSLRSRDAFMASYQEELVKAGLL